MLAAIGHRGNRRTPANMGLSRYRSRARLVAIVDLILSSMSLCLTMILVLGAVIFSTSPVDWGDVALNEHDDDEVDIVKHKEQVKKVVAIIIWLVIGFSGITTIIEIIAAVKLLNATQLGKEPVGALKLSIFWRRVCVAFTVLLVVGDILFFRFHKEATPLLSVIQVLLRVVAIYIVTQYIKELENTTNGATLPVHCNGVEAGFVSGVNYAYIPTTHQQQGFQQPPYNPDFNMAPPSYDEVVKDPPPKINVGDEVQLTLPNHQPN